MTAYKAYLYKDDQYKDETSMDENSEELARELFREFGHAIKETENWHITVEPYEED